jgi:hypothetical protein
LSKEGAGTQMLDNVKGPDTLPAHAGVLAKFTLG